MTVNRRMFAWILVLIITVIFLVIFFKSEGQALSFSTPLRRAWIVGIGLALSAFVFMATIGARRYANVVLFLGAILLPLYGFEIYLTDGDNNEAAWRIKLSQIANEIARPVEREPAVLFRAMRDRGTDAYMYVHPFQHLSDPIIIDGKQFLLTGAVPNKLTVHCRESSGFRVYQSDRYGYANPDQMWDAQPDIAFVGASFVHGACIDQRYHFAGVVRERYPHTLNLGASGSGPLHQLMALREFGPIVKAKLVFWMHSEGADVGSFFGNPSYLFSEMQVKPLVNYLDPAFRQGVPENWAAIAPIMTKQAAEGQAKLTGSMDKAAFKNAEAVFQEWQQTKDAIPPSLAFFDPENRVRLSWMMALRWMALQNTADHIQAAYLGLSRKFGPPAAQNIPEAAYLNKASALTEQQQNETLDVYKRVMERAKKDVEAWGGKLVVVWVTLAPPYEDAVRDQTLAILKALSIPVVDTHDNFKNFPHARDLLFARNGAGFPAHYSEEGNRLLADLILKYVKDDPASSSFAR